MVYLIIGSPKSATELYKSTQGVGANFVGQVVHPNDPVANGFLNGDADYDFSGFFDIKNYHSFESYYKNYDLKSVIK